MKFSAFIVIEAIRTDLKADTPRSAIDEMVGALIEAGAVAKSHRRRLVDAVMRREKKGTTGFGNGVAIPHAKHEDVDGVVGTVALCRHGVDFQALDGEAVHLFFLLLSNPETPEEHLKAMEHIFRSIKNDPLRRFMMQASSQPELVDVLREADEETG
jgi:PTS system fructose-specific IIA component/PTS system nitrogen regulatory IIA component